MSTKPKISIVIPTHDMKDAEFFLKRCLDSVKIQKFKDYEVVISKTGLGMGPNINDAIKRAQGEIVKILFMDDFFAHEDSLQLIVNNFKGGWFVTGCEHTHGEDRFNPHYPYYNDQIHEGNNTIGSPSVLAFENNEPLLFDETMTWLLDCDLYKRLQERYGMPTVFNDLNVVIGVGDHQTTNLLSDEIKFNEHEYMRQKHKPVNDFI